MEGVKQVRVGDRERRAVDDQLMAAVADGMLTLSEYDERAGALWQAKVRTELDALVADLPPVEGELAHEPVPQVARGGPADLRPRRTIAVMSEDQLHATIAPGQDVVGVAVMGKSVLDLRQQDLPSGTRVRARALMGEVEVLVPEGAAVHLTGMSLMGGRKVQTARTGAGPVVHVHALAVMGSIIVRHGEVVPASTAGDPVAAGGGSAQLARVPSSAPARRRPRLQRFVAAVRGSAVGLALLVGVGAVVASGADERVVFSSGVEVVTAAEVGSGDTSREVSVLFGSVTVVVPDGVAVDEGGLVMFGSVDCDQACSSDGRADSIDLRAIGGFGSVEILTQSEYDGRRGA